MSGRKQRNVIGFSVSTLNNLFFVTLTEGARKAATENNVELVVVDAGDDAAKQTSDIEDLVSRNVRADCQPGGIQMRLHRR